MPLAQALLKLEAYVLGRKGTKLMPGKRRFTPKEDREAEHIKESEQARGKSAEDAEQIGYATVNRQKQEHKSDNKPDSSNKK